MPRKSKKVRYKKGKLTASKYEAMESKRHWNSVGRKAKIKQVMKPVKFYQVYLED